MELINPPGKLPSGLAAKVRILRRRAGLSQRALARRAGLCHRTTERLEIHVDHNPPITTLVKIAAALGVTLSALVD